LGNIYPIPDPLKLSNLDPDSGTAFLQYVSDTFLNEYKKYTGTCTGWADIPRALVRLKPPARDRYTFLNEFKIYRDLYRLGGHSKSFGQTKTSSSGEEERINIKPRIITVLRLVPDSTPV
jgi:hypothetical protein